jgi:phage antirepressor YoqD-like protein
MSKAPAFQFYVKDWLSDPQLRMASFQTKGIWIDLLCLMWESQERGKLVGSVSEFCKMLGATETEFTVFLNEAKRLNFASVTKSNIEGNEEVTLENRRMIRDEKDRKNNALRQARFKSNAKSNGEITQEVTPPSSTASSSSKKKERKKKEKSQVPDGTTSDDFLSSLRKNPAYQHIDIDTELSKMDAWLLLPKNAKRRKTPTFILNWLNKIEAPVNGNGIIKPVFGLSDAAKERIEEIERKENGH